MSSRGAGDTISVEVAAGHVLPNVGQELVTHSDLTGITYQVRVTSIKSLRWLPNGNIEVTVRGSKRVAERTDRR